MKISLPRFPFAPRLAVVFLMAFLLPTLLLSWITLNTIRERRQAVQKLLDSGVWSAADNALRLIEDRLEELERQTLVQATRKDPVRDEQNQNANQQTVASEKMSFGRPFLLNDRYDILLPKTGSEESGLSRLQATGPDGPFAKCLQQGEQAEFSIKDLRQAENLYRSCMPLAHSAQEEAALLEARARCLTGKSDAAAIPIYRQLQDRYSQLPNRAGHPYGITSALQLQDWARKQNDVRSALEISICLYRDIRRGRWLLGPAAYDFFVSKIEARLEADSGELRRLNLLDSYLAAGRAPETYRQLLEFVQVLNAEIIPGIKERGAKAASGDRAAPIRFLSNSGGGAWLVSYKAVSEGYAGACWDLSDLKDRWFPEVIRDQLGSGSLRLQLIDDSAAGRTASLSFRKFPLPWRLSASQPGIAEIESTAGRENLLYTVLFAIMLSVMLMGAFLLARDMAREAEASRLKNEFVHNVSHELKTPLSLIRLYSETLQERAELREDQRKEAYQIITKETERLSHLINNVLDFSHIETGRKKLALKRGDVAPAVASTVDAYRYRLERKGFSIRQEIIPDLPPIMMDAEAVAGVVINLLSNAEKFSRENKYILVRLYRQEAHVVLEITDRGIGIAAQEIPHIFDRFYRSPDPLAAEAPGSGLGLTLVRYIIEAHGGRIEVASEPGKGSTFKLFFPIDPPAGG